MSAFADVMALVAALSVGVLLFTGNLVTRRTHDALQAERDKWRAMRDHNRFVTTLAARVQTHADHEVVRVETGGEVVAHLCVTCDKQLPPEWAS